MNEAQRRQIQAFADRHQIDVHVVGSHADDTDGPESDFDYILGVDGGTSRQRQRARRELPRGVAGGEIHARLGETGIDVFRQPLDKLLPHVTFTPRSEPIA